MKLRLLLCLALVLSGVWVGCSTTKPCFVNGNADAQQIKFPIKFNGYREFYTFVAQNTYGGMPTDANTLFKLAADSTTEIVTLNDKKTPCVYFVTPHYFNGGIFDQIRGAQGNGDYYILHPLVKNYAATDTDRGFELVGIAEGNTCAWTNIAGKIRLVTTWHMSADEHPESIYEWNGRVFEHIK